MSNTAEKNGFNRNYFIKWGNDVLASLNIWFKTNKLTFFKSSRTKHVLISTHGDNTIEVGAIKFLALQTANNFNWKTHTDHIIPNISLATWLWEQSHHSLNGHDCKKKRIPAPARKQTLVSHLVWAILVHYQILLSKHTHTSTVFLDWLNQVCPTVRKT